MNKGVLCSRTQEGKEAVGYEFTFLCDETAISIGPIRGVSREQLKNFRT